MQQPGLINSLAQAASLQDQTQIGDYDLSATNDAFLDQILSSLPSWTDFGSGKPAWDDLKQDGNEAFCYEDSGLLVSKLRQHQINGMVQQPQLIGWSEVGDSSPFKSSNAGLESSIQALYNGFAAGSGKNPNPNPSQVQQFLHSQSQNFGAPATAMNQTSATCSAGGAPAQPRQRVRARRGQATDPHSIAERLRRERIAERMKALQELVPNANKTDKATMLDEIVDYVKFLQLQVKVLSMSRLGGAAAVAPLVSSEQATNSKTATTPSDNDKAMTMTEHQVAKLMEEDMGTAMQYLQNKGLCLMPISLASAISSATCQPRNNGLISGGTHQFGNGGPTSPSASVLTVQSAAFGNGVSVNDAASGSKV